MLSASRSNSCLGKASNSLTSLLSPELVFRRSSASRAMIWFSGSGGSSELRGFLKFSGHLWRAARNSCLAAHCNSSLSPDNKLAQTRFTADGDKLVLNEHSALSGVTGSNRELTLGSGWPELPEVSKFFS